MGRVNANSNECLKIVAAALRVKHRFSVLRKKLRYGTVLYQGTASELAEKSHFRFVSYQGMTLVMPQADENRSWSLAPR